MAPLAIGRRLNVPALFQRLANLMLGQLLSSSTNLRSRPRLAVFRDKFRRLHVFGFPIEIENLIFRPEKIFRVSMTFEAPRHAVRLGMIDTGMWLTSP